MSQQRTQPNQEEEQAEEEEFDPYAPLDPHAKGALLIKPFKKGRKPTRRKRPQQPAAAQLGNTGRQTSGPLGYNCDRQTWPLGYNCDGQRTVKLSQRVFRHNA